MTIRDKYPWPEVQPKAPIINHTWFGENQKELFDRFVSPSLRVIVELGTWMGGSCREFYERCPKADIYTIDNYALCKDFIPTEAEPKLKGHVDRLREVFFCNNWHMRDRVVQLNETTWEGMQILKANGVEAELVYIDAGHDFKNCMDDIFLASACWPHAQIIGDDYNWPGVHEAVSKHAKENHLTVEVYNNITWAFV